MAKFQLLLPKMGESVAEATITKWVKNPGDYIEIDDSIVEIATDKVDSEVPSPVSGKLLEQFFAEDDVVEVGSVIAIIETNEPDGEEEAEVNEPTAATPLQQEAEAETVSETEVTPEPEPETAPEEETVESKPEPPLPETVSEPQPEPETDEVEEPAAEVIDHIPGTEQLAPQPLKPADFKSSARFYSPLVRNIAAAEGVSAEDLDSIPGSGADGRLTKEDLLAYIEDRRGDFEQKANEPEIQPVYTPPVFEKQSAPAQAPGQKAASMAGGDEIIEMDRMRRLIADHMVMSKQTSPHVTSFVEADVTNMVTWRNKVKGSFEKRENEKITYTPIFIEAVVKAIQDFPMINVSVNGKQIIKKKNINISMATALPSGNLIVPVIKQADRLNLLGITKAVNDLAGRARNNKLQPDDVQDGTFTITNVGTFGNVMGTPIINQPQVAILAVGAIKKKPAVIETPEGDMIGIRHMMFMSLSYDHRVVDGALGGSFLSRVAYYLENWDTNRSV